jgi:uncharacterized protein (DUF2252 family)
MSVNFFETTCQSTTTATTFGICDEDNKNPAFIDTDTPSQWIATVNNSTGKQVTLTAIDNCISILRPSGEMDSRCDAMLTYSNNVVFVELKNKREDWISGAVEQLEKTIELFKANHDITVFKRKRAFAANKAHPNFKVSHKTMMQEFFNKHKVRLLIEATIPI